MALLLAMAGRAAAGGPTSVMLVSPDSGEAAAIYTTSSEYQALLGATGAQQGRGIATGTTVTPAALGGREITATWLIHDVAVWRVDRIYPEAKGGAWIHTFGTTGGTGLWHRSPHSKALGRLLSRLGLMGEDQGLSLSAPDYPLSSAAEPDTTDPAVKSGSRATWWPALPGLAAGAVIGGGGTLLVLRLLAQRRPHEAGPRQQMVDI